MMINTSEPLDLVEALHIARRLHVVIIPTLRSVRIWSPGLRVPSAVRLAIRSHREEVRTLLTRFDITVCPSVQLHRSHWRYAGHGDYVCDACARLAPWICSAAVPKKEEQRHAS